MGLGRSAKIVSPRKFEIVEEGIPEIKENQILVRLLKSAICGSDLPYFNESYDESSYPLPLGYPGHECLGIVEKSYCKEYKEGDYVMYYPQFLVGFKEFHITESNRLQKLPEGKDLNILTLTQLLGAVAHCVFRLDKPYNKNIVIMGQGPVGLLFTSLLKNLGAKNIIAVDPTDFRLKTAEIMGADIALNPDSCNVIEKITQITGAGAEIVIDAYGQKTDVINLCFDAACHNGQVAFFGICLEESPKLNFNIFFRKELRMIASVGPDLEMDYPYALDMIMRNSIDVAPLITHILPFEDIQKGFEIAVNRLDNAIKIILEF